MCKIHSNNILQYSKCPRTLYLSLYGDKNQKNKSYFADFRNYLINENRNFEKNVLNNLKINPSNLNINLKQGFNKTIELMKRGEDNIYHGILLYENFIGIPDILEKISGKSIFGDYYYKPIDIKNSKYLKESYKFQLMFYSYLLYKIQGCYPKEAEIIISSLDNKNGFNRKSFTLENYIPKFEKALIEINEIIKGKEPNFNIGSVCKDCEWADYCLNEAIEKDDISLIYGLEKFIKESLHNMGIKTIEKFLQTPKKELLKIEGMTDEKLNQLRTQARSFKNQETIIKGNYYFPECKNEVFFDIEGESKIGVYYLMGALLKSEEKVQYHKFIAYHPKEEKEMWYKFLDFISNLDDFYIYHYDYYEKHALHKLKDKYGADSKLFEKIISNMIDIYHIIQNNLVLPLTGYSLKNIANWLGFQWSNERSSGSQSILWYINWLKTGNKKFINSSIIYNQDDCKATMFIKKWLTYYKNLQLN